MPQPRVRFAGMSYDRPRTPPSYRCGNCRVFRVRLWRLPGARNHRLRCYQCALKETMAPISIGQGPHPMLIFATTDEPGGYTRDILDRIPAIPLLNSSVFWAPHVE